MKKNLYSILMVGCLLSGGAEAGYRAWSDYYNLVQGPQGNDDNDGVNNLYEYGLGGDPTNAEHVGYEPEIRIDTGALEYIHPMRSDTNSTLAYRIESRQNLLSNGWAAAAYVILGTNANGYAADFAAVANRIPTDGADQGFFRLAITDTDQPNPVDAYTIPSNGYYKVSNAWIERTAASSNEFIVGVMRADGWLLFRDMASGDARHEFECYAGYFVTGDIIVLGAGKAGEAFNWDYTVEPYVPNVFSTYSDFAGTGTLEEGWSFKWNAPEGWGVGMTGDVASGQIGEVSAWRDLRWSGSQWTADGDNTANNTPSSFLRLSGGGGHPGAAGTTTELDRYAIAVFRVGEPGDYQIGGGWIEGNATGGNGVLVKIFAAGELVKTVEAPANDLTRFEARLEGLRLNEEIAVAVGANGTASKDSFGMDFSVALTTPIFSGVPVFAVADYGAVGNGSTDDRTAIRAAVAAADAAGGGIVRFDGTKTYRVIGLTNSTEEYLFNLENMENIKLEGNGAMLLLHPPDRLANIDASENIQIDGFTVNYDPLPYYQGIITDINPSSLTMDITVPDRYPVPTLQSAPLNDKFFGRTFVPEAPGARSGSGSHLYVDATSIIGGNNRQIRIHARADMSNVLQSALNEGATEFICPDATYGQVGQWVSTVARSSRVTYSNIHFYRILRQGLNPQRNDGPITYSNVDFWIPDETEDPVFHRGNELFISWRGHYLASNNRFGFLVEDAETDGGAMYDDLYNANAHTAKVLATGSKQATLLSDATLPSDFSEFWRPGDWISIWEGAEEAVRGYARIVSISDSGSTSLLVYDREISGVSTNDSVINEDVQNRGTLWRNCVNSSIGAGGATLRVRTPVLFENCQFNNTYFWIYRNEYWEGPRPRDVEFRNCFLEGDRTDDVMDIVKTRSLFMDSCTVTNGRLDISHAEGIALKDMTWVGQGASLDALRVRDASAVWLYGDTTVNGSTNLSPWIDVGATSTIIFAEP